MNGFGGDVEQRTIKVLEGLQANLPFDLDSNVSDLGLLPEDVRLGINAEFFPAEEGFHAGELTHETTVRKLVFEITRRL